MEIKVIGQYLNITKKNLYASDSQEYLTVKFTFNDDWEGLVKTAVFYQNVESVYHVILDSEGSCTIPYEALTESGLLYIGVFGVSGTKRITTNIAVVDISQGSYGNGLTPDEPSEDIYAQIISIMEEQSVSAQATLTAQGVVEGIQEDMEDLYEDYNTNATNKTATFNENVTAKTTEFNDNATEKTNIVDAIKDYVLGIQEEINVTAGEVSENASNAQTSENNAKESETNAGESKDIASQALADLLAMLGTDIATLVAGKVPLSQIPAVAIHEIIQITNESELITLTNVQKYDIAVLITGTGDDKIISVSYQLLADDNTVRSNWVEVGTGYATQSGHSATSGTAENSNMINGHRLVTMTETQYASAVKETDTLYAVYPE